MANQADLILLLLIMVDLFMLATTRIAAAVRASAVQGLLLALLPLALSAHGSTSHLAHAGLISGGTLALKAILIPWLLMRALHKVAIYREVEPFVSQHISLLLGAVVVGVAFWSSAHLPALPGNAPALLVPVSLATVLIGFLIIVTRKKMITQVVGYLVMENGIFVFGMSLAREMPVVVEFGILLDVLVGVFVFGIVIYQISAAFDHMDADVLSELKD